MEVMFSESNSWTAQLSRQPAAPWAQTANHGFSISFASSGQLTIGLDNLFLNLWAVNPVSCATRLKLSVGFSSPDPGTLPQRGVLAWESILVT